MKDAVKMIVAGACTFCVFFMIVKLSPFRFLKRRTLLEKLRLSGL